ncbi:MAG: hypothetical protein KTR18_05145 [Acidiferrobacterales bacterium]|nr:hypothetical protein [Acidiferrobacterales bacterium]
MTLLSSFFILAGILTYIVARGRIEQPARKLLYLPLIIVGFTTLGYLCKENGALLPLFIAIIEITVFRFKSDGRYDKTIVTLFTGTTVVGVLGVCYILFTRYKWLFGGFEFREFSQIERVLTQFRALTFYLSQILAPTTSELSLWHDHFTISTGLFSPVSTFLSAIVLIAMGGLAILSFQRSPLICIGLAWFFVGHAMESTILPLELVHEHRNYLASFGILLILCYAALSAALWLKKFRIGIYAALTAVFLWNSHVLLDRARIWSSEYSFAEHGAKEQPGSAFANYHFARIQLNRFLNGQKEYGELSKTSFLKARALEPDQMVAELALILASENGAFEYDPEWMQTAIDKFPSVAKSAPLQGSIISFLECLDWGVCVNSKKEAQKLFDLFLETNNARFIGYYALYYWKIDYQPEKAEAAFDRSLKGRDVRFWTYYLQYLVEKKKWNLFCEKHPQFETKVKNFEFKNSISALNEISALASYASKCDVHSD